MEMWFNEFSTDGKMSKDQCINFVLKCTGERCSYEDSRIKETYDNYDSDHDGFLSL
jgi:ubiquitin carboxyl-terminal hydrolase 34